MQGQDAISTGCVALDDLLGGGFERGTVTQLYGAPAAGKTNLALSTAIDAAASGLSVHYIDTEGLSSERFDQIASNHAAVDEIATVVNRVTLATAHDFEEQIDAIKDVAEIAAGLDLVVVDSATGFYRLERTKETEVNRGDALRRLADQVAHLLGLARRYHLAVVITNQVFTDPDANRIRPLGGYTLEHWSGTILRLDRFRGGRRRVTLEKHRSRSVGDSIIVEITGAGITGVDAV